MNDATQSTEAEAPRRSGRERRQAESVYLDAKRNIVAERRKKAAKNVTKSSERSVRYRKRKAADESSEEENDEEEDQFVNFSDDEEEQFSSDSEEEEEINGDRAKLTVHKGREWQKLAYNARDIESIFQSGDGSKLFFTNRYTGRRWVQWRAFPALAAAQKSLVAEQDERSITLEYNFHRNSVLSQVPYHADMMPCYEYFAEGIKHITSLESFKIVNYNLTALQLSNCFLSSDDLTSLTKFLAGNRTLSTLNICRTNIESEDTVKALAKALKKHPAIRRVNLAYCSLAGGHDVLDKILTACKTCDSLEIGHEDFESESVATVAKFLGKKHSLTSFSLVGAAVDKENKKLLSEALVKNKTIQKLCLHSNNLQLPAIIRNTKKITKSLSRLTHLELSFNKLPLAGAKAMATFLEEADCKLVSLIMTKNNLTTKGANVLLPALKKNTSLQHLDLSRNWLSDKCAPTVIDLLKHNSTLLTFDLSGNKGLKTVERRRRRRYRFVEGRYTFDETPQVDGGRAKIVKEALFDTTSLESIISSNHTCSVRMTGFNHNDSYEESIRKINALDVREGKKIRLKIVLAKRFKEDLFDLRSFDDVPLQLMPYLLEMLHQEIGCDGYGGNILQQWANYTKNQTDRWTVAKYAKSLSRLYETIKTWQSLPALFARGPGEFCLEEADEAQTTAKKKKKKRNPRKRRKFGDEEDDDDEAWIPKGARKTGEYKLNPETGTWEFIPPPVY